MVLGRLAHARSGISYVIDYIDPVVSDYYWKLPRSQRPPKYAMAYALARLMEPFAPISFAHKPLVAVFHEESSVVRILRETQAGDVIAFREAGSLGEKVNQIATNLQEILSRPRSSKPPTRWEAFDP